MMNDDKEIFGRRAALQSGVVLLTGAIAQTVRGTMATEKAHQVVLRFGVVTDLHHADKAAAGSRYYRDSIRKLSKAAEAFEKAEIDFVVELGDLIDAADSVEVEQAYLATINRHFSRLSKDRHYVLGNHCVDTLTKQEFLSAVGQERSYYSFDRGDFHFVVLDSCFKTDGQPYGRKNFQWTDANVPQVELDWLKADLNATDRKTIVFAHQRFDVADNHGVRVCRDKTGFG